MVYQLGITRASPMSELVQLDTPALRNWVVVEAVAVSNEPFATILAPLAALVKAAKTSKDINIVMNLRKGSDFFMGDLRVSRIFSYIHE